MDLINHEFKIVAIQEDRYRNKITKDLHNQIQTLKSKLSIFCKNYDSNNFKAWYEKLNPKNKFKKQPLAHRSSLYISKNLRDFWSKEGNERLHPLVNLMFPNKNELVPSKAKEYKGYVEFVLIQKLHFKFQMYLKLIKEKLEKEDWWSQQRSKFELILKVFSCKKSDLDTSLKLTYFPDLANEIGPLPTDSELNAFKSASNYQKQIIMYKRIIKEQS